MQEFVSVMIGGAPFPSFEAVTVHGSVKEACRAFEMTFTDTAGAPSWPSLFKGQPEVKVFAGGDLIFTGYIDRRAPHLGPEAYRIAVGARSKGQDVTDSTVDHTRPDYVQGNVLAVAKDQDRFGCNFSCDFTPDGFNRWRPNPGDRLFESLAPLCEEENATMAGQPDGSIKITRAGETAEPQGGPLIEGEDFFAATADFDDSGQHSQIKAHGQSYKGSGAQALQIEGSAMNSTVSRMRPLDFHHDRETDRPRLKRLAARRRDKEQGEGVRATFSVKGFRDRSGALWTPGKKAFVKSPSLDLCQYLLIEGVLYHQDARGHERGGGTVATLQCVDPRAHGGKGGGVNKSGDAWGFDDSAPE